MTEATEEGNDNSVPYQRRPYRRDRERRRLRRRRSRSKKPENDVSKSDGSNEEAAFEFKPHHAKSVPREVNLEQTFDVAENESITTVMLRHIPCKYTQGNLMREIDEMGFEGTYDFFYLPVDTRNKTSVGYAFLNFPVASDAERFTSVFTEYRFKRHQNEKIAEVSPAKIQGLRNNIIHFANSAVVHARNNKYRPIVLQQGIKRDFADLLVELHAEVPPPYPLADPPMNSSFPDMPLAEVRAPISQLNALAEEFVPAGVTKALNPMAEEFIPSVTCIMHSVPQKAEPGLTSQTSEDVFKQARTDLEERVRLLLQQAAAPPSKAIANAREPAAVRAIANVKLEQLQLSSKCFMAEESCIEDVCGSSWVAQAFEVLVDDLGFVSSAGHKNNTSGGWVAEAFQLLIDEETLIPIQAECWVAEAFTSLAYGVISGAPKCADFNEQSQVPDGDHVNVKAVSPNGNHNGGGWVAEAFRALTSVSTPRRKTANVQEGGWIAEAFRALSTNSNKKLADKYPKEETCTSPGNLTPRSVTPRLGDALQRLQALGGWAWIAFA